MTKIIPFNQPINNKKNLILAAKIISIVVQVLILVLIGVGLLTYFIGFHNKPPPDDDDDEVCPNPFSGSVCDECGLIHDPPNVKIAKGVPVANKTWPAAVMLSFEYTDYLRLNGSWFFLNRKMSCGATLINRRTILTAGHCIIESINVIFRGSPYTIKIVPNYYSTTYAEMYYAYINAQSLNGWTWYRPPAPLFKLGIEEFTRHEDYDPLTYLNNIAVFKLTYELELDHNTQIACLPDPKYDSYPTTLNIDGFIHGWGESVINGTYPNMQNQNAKVKIYDSETCKSSQNPYFKNQDKQLCAGSAAADVCSGDAGGGLYIKDKVNDVDKYIMVGIVSFGASCASGPPSIFTKVSAYRDWILHHVSY